jgi:hypothetical protein
MAGVAPVAFGVRVDAAIGVVYLAPALVRKLLLAVGGAAA